jgi:Flp pilus assembly protein TadD
MPELLRMKGKVLLSRPQPNIEEAERHIREALELSRRTDAKAWELRAAIDLATLIADRGEAKRSLQSALEGFVEGSETADIKTANEILEGL